MALKKDSNSIGSDQEKSQNEDTSLLELKNLENKKEIQSEPREISKGNDHRMDFSILGLINRF